MARWRKLLARMLTDANPSGYTYDDAAIVLSHLGFELAPPGRGSHRKWRKRAPNGNAVVIGMVEKGAGRLRAYLIRDMVSQLRANALVPPDLEQPE